MDSTWLIQRSLRRLFSPNAVAQGLVENVPRRNNNVESLRRARESDDSAIGKLPSVASLNSNAFLRHHLVSCPGPPCRRPSPVVVGKTLGRLYSSVKMACSP